MGVELELVVVLLEDWVQDTTAVIGKIANKLKLEYKPIFFQEVLM